MPCFSLECLSEFVQFCYSCLVEQENLLCAWDICFSILKSIYSSIDVYTIYLFGVRV